MRKFQEPNNSAPSIAHSCGLAKIGPRCVSWVLASRTPNSHTAKTENTALALVWGFVLSGRCVGCRIRVCGAWALLTLQVRLQVRCAPKWDNSLGLSRQYTTVAPALLRLCCLHGARGCSSPAYLAFWDALQLSWLSPARALPRNIRVVAADILKPIRYCQWCGFNILLLGFSAGAHRLARNLRLRRGGCR